MTHSPLRSPFIKRHGRALLVFFILALVSTLVSVASAKTPKPIEPPAVVKPSKPSSNQSSNGSVKMSSKFSQGKLMQGSSSELVLDISIEPPAPTQKLKARTPVDMVVILDRSSSMSSDQKFTLAKKAIRSLVDRLTSEDRMSLITFSQHAQVNSSLIYTDASGRQKIEQILSQLSPGGSTNMSHGLELAKQELSKAMASHTRRVILLSDGQANAGIKDPNGLRNLVKTLTRDDIVVSTIGMGLGFNENMMSMLADHGMGSFSYLEHLAGLDGLFEKDLNDARQQYTNYSQLKFRLPHGVGITDAGGYPIEKGARAGEVSIPLGQLLHGRKKSLMVTFSVPTHELGTLSLGEFELNYKVPEGDMAQLVSDHALAVEVVEPQRRQEVFASVSQDIYKKSWVDNRLGLLQKRISHSLKSGDEVKAKREIANYEQQLQAVKNDVGFAIQDDELENELKEIKEEVEDSFRGSAYEQQVKQNRNAKKNLESSRSTQRRY